MPSYDDRNIFARILRGELPASRIFETEDFLAIMDVMPQSKGHCLLIPKAASRNVLDASDVVLSAALPLVARLARAAQAAFSADGVAISQFNEEPAGQTVFHLHFHVIPRYANTETTPHAEGMADPAVLAEQAAAIRAQLGAL